MLPKTILSAYVITDESIEEDREIIAVIDSCIEGGCLVSTEEMTSEEAAEMVEIFRTHVKRAFDAVVGGEPIRVCFDFELNITEGETIEIIPPGQTH